MHSPELRGPLRFAAMDLIFHGPLGMELSLDRSAGVPRVKAAEHDSPALLVVGRALTAIEGVPVGEIRDKKSWLAVVAKLQAPERPLSLTFEPAAPPPEEDPVAAEERARAELQPVAERAECALSTEHIEERFLARERARMAKDYRTADAIERELTLAGVLHDKARWWIPGTSREGPMPCARDTGALCRYYSAGRPCPHGDRCQFLHADDSRPGERVPVASSAPALGERPTRRHLVAATESARALQPPVESEPEGGPRPPSDAEIFDMVLAREKARIEKDYAAADRMRAEMAAAGLTVVYRDATGRDGREAKKCGALTWSTVDGRTGPPALSTAEIESRLRAWLHARDVDQNPSRATDLLADCKARGIGTSASIWFTAQASGPLPSLVREASVGRGPSDEYIRERLFARFQAIQVRDLNRADGILDELQRAGVRIEFVGEGYSRVATWRTPDGRSGPRPPDDGTIFDMVLQREKARIHSDFRTGDRIACELNASGVFIENRDAAGRQDLSGGAHTWLAVDGREGPPALSESKIEALLRKWLRTFADGDEEGARNLQADWLARGIRIKAGPGSPGTRIPINSLIQGQNRGFIWFTGRGMSGPMPTVRPEDRGRRSRSRSRSRSRKKARKRSRKQSKSKKAAAPSAAPGLDEQRPTRRHLVAAAAAPPAAPSEMSYSD